MGIFIEGGMFSFLFFIKTKINGNEQQKAKKRETATVLFNASKLNHYWLEIFRVYLDQWRRHSDPFRSDSIESMYTIIPHMRKQ